MLLEFNCFLEGLRPKKCELWDGKNRVFRVKGKKRGKRWDEGERKQMQSKR